MSGRPGFAERRPAPTAQQALAWWRSLIAAAWAVARDAEAGEAGGEVDPDARERLRHFNHQLRLSSPPPFPVREASATLAVESFLHMGRATFITVDPRRRGHFAKALSALAGCIDQLLDDDALARSAVWRGQFED